MSTETELRNRLAETERLLLIAERVCAMAGWTANTTGSDRDKALTELWMEWAAERPHLTGPKAWPDLDDDGIAHLAARRDAKRAATLRALTTPTPAAPSRRAEVNGEGA